MVDLENKSRSENSALTWVTAVVVTGAFLLWTLFIFFAVGVKWPPAWNFGALPDVPGQSVYSTHPPVKGQPQSGGSLLQGDELAPQHVREPTRQFMNKEHTE